MSFFEPGKLSQFMRDSKTGLWKVEFTTTGTPRFFADEVMDELLGISWEVTPEERFIFHHAHIHPDDLEMFENYSNKLLEASAEVTYRYIHPTLGEQYVRCSGTRDNTIKDYWCILGMHKDISDTIRLERERIAEIRLAEENQQLKFERSYADRLFGQIMKLQTCGILSYKIPSHELLIMNDMARRLYGMDLDAPIDELDVARALRKCIFDHEEETLARLNCLAENNDTVSYTLHMPQKDGGFAHIWVVSQVIDLPDGDRAIVSALQDISQLTEIQNANEAKKRFLFNMSHDIRTPMNAIMGYTDLMEKSFDNPDKQRDYLSKIRGASEFLLSLINDVLEMSRIESGKVEIQEVAWDASRFWDSLYAVFEDKSREKHIAFTSEFLTEHRYVYCDPVKLREILLNLLSNAFKYTPDGGRIHMEVRELPSDVEGYVNFKTQIIDSGLGMSKEFLPHLFDEFSREVNSTERKIEGTGLGMSIVKKYVDLLGGTISVESELGKGTCFTVVIPHRIAQKENVEDLEPDMSAGTIDFTGKRILLAEDNDLNAEIACEILADEGFIVERAEDGQIALEMLSDHDADYYAVVLMDIQMPRMNGYEASLAIRNLQDRQKANIPIVAMTANAFEEDKQEAMKAGMNGHIAKPVDVRLLFDTLACIIK